MCKLCFFKVYYIIQKLTIMKTVFCTPFKTNRLSIVQHVHDYAAQVFYELSGLDNIFFSVINIIVMFDYLFNLVNQKKTLLKMKYNISAIIYYDTMRQV